MNSQETTSRKKRKIRFWHIAVMILGVLIVSFAVFRVVMRSGVDGRIEAIRKAGYPITLTELNEWYVLPPFAENAADRITRAFACLQLPPKQDMENVPLLGGTKLPDRGQPLDEDTLAQIGEILQNNGAALKLLREGAAIPHCRYGVDFTQGYACQLPHIEHFRSAGKLLCLEALWCTQHGELERATDAVLTSLAVADSLKAEPVLISQLVRRACRAQTLVTLEFLLNQTEFEPEQLTQLERALAGGHDPNGIARALAAERCFGHAAFSRPTEAGLPGSSGTPVRVLVAGQRAVGLLDASWAIFLDLMDEYIRAAQLPPWQRQEAAGLVESKLGTVSRIHVMVHTLVPACGRVIQLDTESWARTRTARVALAVERHRLAIGDLPGKLTDLVPAYLAGVPKDPLDGEPLRYKKLDSGFVVYSVGPDQQDDDGKERPARRKSRQQEPNYDITFIIER